MEGENKAPENGMGHAELRLALMQEKGAGRGRGNRPTLVCCLIAKGTDAAQGAIFAQIIVYSVCGGSIWQQYILHF
ncbi:hypothetical protein AA18889_2170 [Acetobacter senegalensis DSM 18889]|nr:hypothetical protein AA18889_2170 [Acetobacter senegalensis DSM 18889]